MTDIHQEMSPNIKLYVVRHGETEGMKLGVRLTDKDPLSSTGVDQSRKLTKRLQKVKFNFVYCSPTLRSIQTLEILNKTLELQNPIFDSDLVERKEATSLIGVKTEQMPWEYIKKNRLKRRWRYQDAESFDDIYHRAQRVLNKFQSHKNGSQILVVSHGSFTRALFAVILLGETLTPKQYFTMTEKLYIGSTGLSKLEYSKKYYEDYSTWKIITWMDTSHIEP